MKNLLLAILTLCMLFLLYERFSSKEAEEVTPLIKTKGIIIVDNFGNDRILIGAPIPNSNDRVRTNLEKAKEVWGESLELNDEWDWFEELNNNSNGIIILDENGHDRIALGNGVPDPNIGKRIGKTSTGIVINDENGFERTGYGHNQLNDNGDSRVTIGLDNPGSSEGLILTILENGTTGINMFNKEGQLFFGKSYNSFGISDSIFNGLLIKNDKKEIIYNLNSVKD